MKSLTTKNTLFSMKFQFN